MKKYTILAAMLFGMLGGVYAQDSSSSTEKSGGGSASYAPEAGDLSGAILFGRGNFLEVTDAMMPPSAGLLEPGSSWVIPGTAPQGSMISKDENPVTNIVGAEVRYFLVPNIALKLSGGAIIRDTPARPNTVGYITEGSDIVTWIPSNDAVVKDNSFDLNINIGSEYHFTSKYSRLFPYAGVTVPFYYARRSMFDPTIDETNIEEPKIIEAGMRHVQMFGFGVQAVAGVDYYLMEGLYFGFEIKPVSYIYAFSEKMPAPGMPTAQSDNHTVSFLSQTFLKVGFRF